MTKQCAAEPGLVTNDLLQAAKDKTEELFSSLVTAKNEWQYAVKNQDEKYQRVLQIKAEYAEWRALSQRLGEILDGEHGADVPHCPQPLNAGASNLFFALSARRAAGSR